MNAVENRNHFLYGDLRPSSQNAGYTVKYMSGAVLGDLMYDTVVI